MDRRKMLTGLAAHIGVLVMPKILLADEPITEPANNPTPGDKPEKQGPQWDGVEEGPVQRGTKPETADESDRRDKERSGRKRGERGSVSGSIRARGGSGSRNRTGGSIRIGDGRGSGHGGNREKGPH